MYSQFIKMLIQIGRVPINPISPRLCQAMLGDSSAEQPDAQDSGSPRCKHVLYGVTNCETLWSYDAEPFAAKQEKIRFGLRIFDIISTNDHCFLRDA
jgi:hypothetical protein